MKYCSTSNSECYFPPLLGNGEITLSPDCEGMLNYTEADYAERGIDVAFDGGVVRCNRRMTRGHGDKFKLQFFSFGRFVFNEGSELKEWEQELDPVSGVVKSLCSYEDGVEIRSECFIHPHANIYALKKTFQGIKGGRKIFSYEFMLDGFDELTSRVMTYPCAYAEENSAHIRFHIYGQDIYDGEAVVLTDKKSVVTTGEDQKTAKLSFEAENGESVTFYYFLEDDLECEDYRSAIRELKEKIKCEGFEKLAWENRMAKQEFEELGYVHTYDEKLNSIYRTAMYDLQCYTTKYSIAVGLNNGSWCGSYFAFDEYYGFLALLGANRLELAKRVPKFRREVCFTNASRRASSSRSEEEAHFCWQTTEYGEEMSPNGFWLDHVFHMPLIAMEVLEYYEHTGDIAFLEQGYRMMRACAKFFTRHMIYYDRDRAYVGKCTDMERLGSSIENPFMTACGAIKLLESVAAAAEILNIDGKYREECLNTAKQLRDNLPVENDMYVPYLGCGDKSIAVFAGKFPYDVIPKSDKKLINAWIDFEKNGGKFGNMYQMGVQLSPWYACWKAEGYARMEMPSEAYEALRQSYLSVGVFDEMFEINEPGVRYRPWFMTAGGLFISAVNEMLLQSDGKTIHILPAFPCDHSDGDISFKLSAKGGAIVEAEIVKGKLKQLHITMKDGSVAPAFKVLFKGEAVDV